MASVQAKHMGVKMTHFWALPLVLTLVVVPISCTSHRNGNNDTVEEKSDYMEIAQSAWTINDFDKVIEMLEPTLKTMEEVPEQGEAVFLLGKAYFMRAEETASYMSTQARMFQAMPSQAVSDLLKAYECFMDAVWVVEDRELLIEIYYFAGKTQDTGYLQDFKKASEHYKSAFSISATHEYGKKALERYSLLTKWFETYKSE